MIKRIYIDNVRCFSNFDFAPAETTLLVGRNGSGKSTLLEVLDGLTDIVVGGAEVGDVFDTASLTRWQERHRQRFELEVADARDTYQYELVLLHDLGRETVTIESERLTRGADTLYRYEDGHVHLHLADGGLGSSFPLGGGRSYLPQIPQRPETARLCRFIDLASRIQLVQLDATGMESTSEADEEHLAPDGSNFASWYRHLQQEMPERLAEYFERLAEVMPGFTALKLTKVSSRVRELVATMKSAGTSYEVDFDELSDGQRVLIVLHALLMETSDEPRTLLLDEPGNALALEEIQPWLLELADAVGDSGQLVVASHNPEVIDHLASRHPVLLERPDGGPVRAQSIAFDREVGLTASTQLARGLVGSDQGTRPPLATHSR